MFESWYDELGDRDTGEIERFVWFSEVRCRVVFPSNLLLHWCRMYSRLPTSLERWGNLTIMFLQYHRPKEDSISTVQLSKKLTWLTTPFLHRKQQRNTQEVFFFDDFAVTQQQEATWQLSTNLDHRWVPGTHQWILTEGPCGQRDFWKSSGWATSDRFGGSVGTNKEKHVQCRKRWNQKNDAKQMHLTILVPFYAVWIFVEDDETWQLWPGLKLALCKVCKFICNFSSRPQLNNTCDIWSNWIASEKKKKTWLKTHT